MAAKFDLRLNIAGVTELRKSPEMEAALLELASSYAGDGWEAETRQMPTRVIASVFSTDPEAIAEELDSHGLVGQMGGGA